MLSHIIERHQDNTTDFIYLNKKKLIQSLSNWLTDAGYKVLVYYTEIDETEQKSTEYRRILESGQSEYDFIITTKKGITGNNNNNSNLGKIYSFIDRYDTEGTDEFQFISRCRTQAKDITFCVGGNELSKKELNALNALIRLCPYVGTTDDFLRYKYILDDAKTSIYYELLYYANKINQTYNNVLWSSEIEILRQQNSFVPFKKHDSFYTDLKYTTLKLWDMDDESLSMETGIEADFINKIKGDNIPQREVFRGLVNNFKNYVYNNELSSETKQILLDNTEMKIEKAKKIKEYQLLIQYKIIDFQDRKSTYSKFGRCYFDLSFLNAVLKTNYKDKSLEKAKDIVAMTEAELKEKYKYHWKRTLTSAKTKISNGS
jgi:hypothetical protein